MEENSIEQTELEQADQTGQEGAGEALQEGAEQATDKATEAPANPQAEELETLRKRLADTQAWAHKTAQEAAELRRRTEQTRVTELEAGLSPEVLDAVARASEASQLRARQQQEAAVLKLESAVKEAVPDAMALMENPEFGKYVALEADKARGEGRDPANPITAVAVMNKALREFNQSAQRAAAQAADKARKAKLMQAQSVPGAGTAAQAPGSTKDWRQDASIVKDMSPAEFEKLRRKGLGY